MTQSKAPTVDAYLSELETDRREVVASVLRGIRAFMPPGFAEVMNWGMITWEVPLERYPNTYNKKPLMYASLAAQKRHYAIYLMCLYAGSSHLPKVEAAYAQAGIKLDMGKCCIRFRKPEGLLLPVIQEVIANTSVEDYIKIYEDSQSQRGTC